MNDEKNLQEYSPPWALHVVGFFLPRQVEDGVPLPQTINMVCRRCKDTHRVVCHRGLVRQQVARFALQHLHRDPLKEGPR